jgi:hypothetical protein
LILGLDFKDYDLVMVTVSPHLLLDLDGADAG